MVNFLQEKQPAKKPLFLFLNKNWDLQIFLHNEGEEFWLAGPDFPIEIISVRLPVESGGNMALTQIYLNEKKTTQIDRTTAPCVFYKQNNEFIECGKKQIWELIKSRINCSIANLKSIIPNNSEILECNSVLNAGITYRIMMSMFAEFSRKSSQNNCPIPCQQSSYYIKLRYLHKNALMDPEYINMYLKILRYLQSHTTHFWLRKGLKQLFMI